jgi:hypothetical protein
MGRSEGRMTCKDSKQFLANCQCYFAFFILLLILQNEADLYIVKIHKPAIFNEQIPDEDKSNLEKFL